jgi:hypothetical protein
VKPKSTFLMIIYFNVTVFTIFMTFDDLRATFVRTVECFQLCVKNKLLSSSNSKLDRWIMFLILHRFMEVINDLEFFHRFIVLSNFSIH